jgi:hypothetical protein
MRTRRQALFGATAAAAFLLAGCPSPADEQPGLDVPPAGPVAPLSASDERITGPDGSVLLTIDNVPGDIRVDDTTEFGAAQRFAEASAAPDGEWFAVVTSGAAHSGGWLVRSGTREPRPAAFQYGGSVSIGPWNDDGRRVVFALSGPAGDRTLVIVDRNQLGQTVEASALPVRTPDHERFRPEERTYEAVEWRDGQLAFRMRGEPWIFNPETRTARRQD